MSHIKHHFVSGKADGTDATLVKPTNWNEDHDMTTDTDGVVLGRLAGAGAGPVQELPFGAVLPYGTVLPFAGPTSPTGWLICDGSSLLRATYPGLFAAIGTAYGAVDGAHFSIPDLRGRTVAGLDPTGTRLTNASIAPNGNTLGGAGGVQATATTTTISSSGSNYFNFGDGLARVYLTQTSGSITGGSASAGGSAGGSQYAYINDPVSVSGFMRIDGTFTVGVSGTGTSSAFNVVQPTLLMNWIIKT